jgi:hypothetical protein
MDLRWVTPFTAVLAAPFDGGKTTWIFRFITHVHEMVNSQPEKIIYYLSDYQKIFDNYPEVDFQQGLPSMNKFNGTERTWVVIDQMMTRMEQSVSDLFTKYSHPRNSRFGETDVAAQ